MDSVLTEPFHLEYHDNNLTGKAEAVLRLITLDGLLCRIFVTEENPGVIESVDLELANTDDAFNRILLVKKRDEWGDSFV